MNHRFVTRPVSSVTLPDMHCSFPGIPTQLNLNHPEKRAGQRGASAEKQGRTEQSGRHERVHPSIARQDLSLSHSRRRQKEGNLRKKEGANERAHSNRSGQFLVWGGDLMTGLGEKYIKCSATSAGNRAGKEGRGIA